MYIVRTELEKKLHKLPDSIDIDSCLYALFITKIKADEHNDEWFIDYKDEADNTLFSVQHKSLQAAVDTALKEIKNL